MTAITKTDVLSLYQSGVLAVEEITDGFRLEDWALPACGEWDATDTVRHLVGVASWYHDWLDRSLAGHTDAPFGENEFDQRNADRVKKYGNLDGPEATARFLLLAGEYLDRTTEEWDRPFGFPMGTATVGQHVGIAATEWHLHAWDLTANNSARHRPDDPAGLLTAAGLAVASTTGGIRGRILALAIPLAARRSPWETVLDKSGRFDPPRPRVTPT